MDQVTASIETLHEQGLKFLTTRYLSECGCEWVVDMWGNVRRVKICPRDTNDIRLLDQLSLEFKERDQDGLPPRNWRDWTPEEILEHDG